MRTDAVKKRWGIPRLFFLILLIFIFFSGIIFSGKTLSTSQFLSGTTPGGPYTGSSKTPSHTIKPQLQPFTFDLTGNAWVNEPNPYIIKKSASESVLPAWNTGEGLGMPLIANPNTEVFNPLKTFLNLNPGPFMQDMFFLLRLLIMGIFTFLFLFETGLSRLSSLFGAAFFMLSGYSVWWINLHPLSTMAYVPGLFYFYEKSASGNKEGKNFLYYFLFSLFFAFCIFGGKVPVLIMALMLLFIYSLFKNLNTSKGTGRGIKQTLKGLFPARLILLTAAGMIMASALILPFMELLSHSSFLAKSVRTGASSHTLPLIPSITMWQPLFFGYKNYFYGSWLEWTPKYMMPYAGITVLLLFIYSVLNKRVLLRVLPFSLFGIFLFLKIFGLIPNDIFIGIPMLGSMNFIKYHGMIYFSIAVISAYAVEDIKTGRSPVFYAALTVTAIILTVYFYSLYSQCPPEKIHYIKKVLIVCISGLSITGVLFYLSGVIGRQSGLSGKKLFVSLLFIFMLAELYIYMPKEYPERLNPYTPPPYLDLIREDHPFRITGDGPSVPPLISSAIGLYDLRGINVLIPDNYYQFFENLISFSIPYTNNPSALLSAASPLSDLLGVKYILSTNKLDIKQLKQALSSHLEGLRIIRFFDSMKKHTIKGGNVYGYFSRAENERFSLYFLNRFNFVSKLKITEPYLFIGLTLKDTDEHTGTAEIKLSIDHKTYSLTADQRKWTDRWIDISEFMGKTADITIEGDLPDNHELVLGSFGLSNGRQWEENLLNDLYKKYFEESKHLKYIGQYEGIHIYENVNVMPRAFMLHKAKKADSLKQVISELQDGFDFRKTALITGKNMFPIIPGGTGEKDTVTIKKYFSSKVEIDVTSEGGLLVLSDLYYPGWKVKVNDEDRDIIRTFGSLRGVVVPEGKSSVVFYYRPLSLYTGIVISFIFLLGWIVFLFIKSKKTKQYA